ncbi:MAG TPA: VTT domain-containing protein [Candidatus Angelobacter sp.]|nr:VTT domain-containing protein [Candidatus Angelobacter sp.]
MAIIGSLIGGYLSYALGREGGREALEKRLSPQRAVKLYASFDRHAFWTLFLPALVPPPFPYSPFLLAAGALNYARHKFLLAVGLGRAIRYTALAYLGSLYSRQIFGFFHRYYSPVLWSLIGLAAAGGIAALIWTIIRKRQHKPVIPKGKVDQQKAA